MLRKVIYCVLFALFSVTAALILVSCCDDKGSNLPVSDLPIDEITCNDIGVVPITQQKGKPVQITCSDEFQKIDVLWGDSTEVETIVKTGSVIVGYHIYLKEGAYIVKVTAFNQYGYRTQCQCTVSISGNTDPVQPEGTKLSITATPSYGRPPLDVAFSYTFSADDGATAKSVSWEFGDGNTSTLTAPHNIYNAVGTFSVSCSVTDTKNRVSTAVATVVIRTEPEPDPGNLPPTISITSDKSTVDVTGTVKFTASASDPDGTIANYEWFTGDGGGESGASRTSLDHLYYNTGGASYDAYCIATDNDGATTQSNTIKITVKPNQAPVVKSEINGEPEGSTPTVDKDSTVTIDMCSSTDTNAGDSISGSRYSSTGLNPSSKDGTACSWNATATTSGTIAIVLHVTDSYGKESNAKSRQLIVRDAVQCKYSGYQVSKVVFNYDSISWTTSCGIAFDRSQNNPSDGAIFKKAYCLITDVPNVLAGSDQTISGNTVVTWTVKVLGTDCKAGDTLPVYTNLEGSKPGDTNSNQEVHNAVVGQNYNYTTSINSKQNGIRTWRYYVSGEPRYYNQLRNDVQ